MTASPLRESRLPVGSSARRITGSPATARATATRQLLPGDLVANRELVGIDFRLAQRERRNQLALRERLVHLGLHLRFVVVRVNVGCHSLLLQVVVLRLHAEVLQRGFRRLDFELSVLQLLIQLSVDELQNHAVSLHRGARVEEDAFDPPLGRRGNPTNVLGHERAEAAHLAQEGPALDGVNPDRRALDAGRRGLQTRQPQSVMWAVSIQRQPTNSPLLAIPTAIKPPSVAVFAHIEKYVDSSAA